MRDNEDSMLQLHDNKFKLPKLTTNKIEEANQFINDPSAALKIILSKQTKKYADSHRTIENKNIHVAKINMTKNRVATLQQQQVYPQANLISLKLRKFRPANGSYSQFYAEQLFIDGGRNKRPQGSTIGDVNIPRLELNRRAHTRRNNLSSLSTEKISSRAIYQNETSYMQKLRKIRENSEVLRENSRHLLKKADSVVSSNNHYYTKLQDQSMRILTGEEKYVLDEQFSATYRNNALTGHHRWNSRR